jgi:hypothetical protein
MRDLFVVWFEACLTRAFAESRDAAICPISGQCLPRYIHREEEPQRVQVRYEKRLLCRVQVSIHYGSM